MTDIASILKSEITRLARKELRVQLEPHRKSVAQLKNQVAALRDEVGVLKRELKALNKVTRRGVAPAATEASKPARMRFTAKGFATMRTHLGLSRAEMGMLIGSSDQSVRKWEDGTAVPRAKFQQAIFALRGVGRRAIAERLKASSTN
ncbi:helix-turn-helix domain-containing protein [Pseudoduganella sp. R-34]|uniref:helix-turn-helix domain-containing protein n=1 Tax=Pseudoduganella sp. R-34 TaxID=3404062 RepID=UPI003CFB5D13